MATEVMQGHFLFIINFSKNMSLHYIYILHVKTKTTINSVFNMQNGENTWVT